MSTRIPPGLDEADTLLPIEAPRWYVARVIGGRERQAVASLRQSLRKRGPFGRNLQAFAPMEARWVKKSGPRSRIVRALIPGYVFVEAATGDLHLVTKSEYVIGLLSRSTPLGSEPVPARGQAMSFLRDLVVSEAFGAFNHTYEPPAPFKTDQSVMVKLGRWASWTGKVLSMTPEGRVKVLLSCMLGKEHVKVLDAEALKAA